MTQNSQNQALAHNLEALAGAKVSRAQSSLDSFAIVFVDGRGLLMSACVDDGECSIDAKVVDASQIVPPSEAVCAVDWSWIYGQSVVPDGVKEGMTQTGAAVKITLTSVGTITVASGMWQGKPFLSFMPYKPTK